MCACVHVSVRACVSVCVCARTHMPAYSCVHLQYMCFGRHACACLYMHVQVDATDQRKLFTHSLSTSFFETESPTEPLGGG